MTVKVFHGLNDSDYRLAGEVVTRSGGNCEVGATGCNRRAYRYLLVDDRMPLSMDSLLMVCALCSERCVADPALPLRLAGVTA